MILEKIVAEKRISLRELKMAVPLKQMEARIVTLPCGFSFQKALSGDTVAIIAEIKKASPSRGVLVPGFDPVALAKAYKKGGADALSVITEEKFFLGSPHHLTRVKEAVPLPVLRKDFIIDPYQIYETAALGGDALLLLASVLDRRTLVECLREAEGLNLATLVEVHNERELDGAVNAGAEVVGINNRDLRTFDTRIQVTKRIAPLVPPSIWLVSESGIQEKKDLEELASFGIDGALIGEALVRAGDPAEKTREFKGIRKEGRLRG